MKKVQISKPVTKHLKPYSKISLLFFYFISLFYVGFYTACTPPKLESPSVISPQNMEATQSIAQHNLYRNKKNFEGEVWMTTNHQDEATIFVDANRDGVIELLVVLGSAVFPYEYEDKYYSAASVILTDSSATIVNAEREKEFIFSVDRNLAKYSRLDAALLTGSTFTKFTFGKETSINSAGLPVLSFLKEGSGYKMYHSVHQFLNNTPGEKIGDGSIIGCRSLSEIQGCDSGGPGSTSCSIAYGQSSASTTCTDGCFACCWLQHYSNNVYVARAGCFEE